MQYTSTSVADEALILADEQEVSPSQYPSDLPSRHTKYPSRSPTTPDPPFALTSTSPTTVNSTSVDYIPYTNSPSMSVGEGVHVQTTVFTQYDIQLTVTLILNTTNNVSNEQARSYLRYTLLTLIWNRIGDCLYLDNTEVQIIFQHNEITIATRIYVCDAEGEKKLIASLNTDPLDLDIIQTINTDDNDMEVFGDVTVQYDGFQDTSQTEQEVSNDIPLEILISIAVGAVFCLSFIVCGIICYVKKDKGKDRKVIKQTKMHLSQTSNSDIEDEIDAQKLDEGFIGVEKETIRSGFGAQNVDEIAIGRDQETSVELEDMYDNKETKRLCKDINDYNQRDSLDQVLALQETDYI